MCMKVSGKVGNRPMNNCLNFGGDSDHRLNTWIVFRIRHYCEIRKVVSSDCAALRCRAGRALAGIDHHSNYGVITSPALGGGRHCPIASSFISISRLWVVCMQMCVIGTPEDSTEKPHSVPCQNEGFCLNGGTCYHFESLDRDYCV